MKTNIQINKIIPICKSSIFSPKYLTLCIQGLNSNKNFNFLANLIALSKSSGTIMAGFAFGFSGNKHTSILKKSPVTWKWSFVPWHRMTECLHWNSFNNSLWIGRDEKIRVPRWKLVCTYISFQWPWTTFLR